MIGQPTDADHVTLKKHLRAMFVKKRKSPLLALMEDLKGLPRELQAEALKAAVAANPTGGDEPSTDTVMEGLYQPEGCRFWFWMLARKHHPDLTQARAAEMITEENVDQVLAEMFIASGLRDAEKKATGRTG